MLKAVIFDMDGVLIDSEPLHAKATIQALSKYGITISMQYCYKFIGSTTKFMMETIKKDYNVTISTEELLDYNDKIKQQLLQKEMYPIIPGVRDLIKDLYAHGIQLAIASSSELKDIQFVVEKLDLQTYFGKLVSGEMVANPKPAPDIFLKAVEELGVNASECLIIEDSMNGIMAAEQANIKSVGFINPNSGNQDLSRAYSLIESFKGVSFEFIETTYQHAYKKPATIGQTN